MSNKFSVWTKCRMIIQHPHFLTTFITILLFACASKPNNYQAFNPSADPVKEMEILNQEVQEANNQQLPLLAPDNFSLAKKAKLKAEKLHAEGSENPKILEAIAVSKAYLRLANQSADLSKSSFAPIVSARADALRAHAEESQAKEFKKTDDKFFAYTKEAEEGRVQITAEERTKLENQYRQHELVAIIYNYLVSTKNNIEKAKSEGAEKISPHMLNLAQEKYKKAQEMIEKDRYNDAQIRPLVDAAVAQGDWLLKITHEAKIAAEKTPEQIALENQKKNQEINSLQRETQIAQVITHAKEDLNKKDAQVFRDGKNVVIRINGLSFNKDNSSVNKKERMRLTRVQQALAQFLVLNPQKITVQSHSSVSKAGKTLTQEVLTQRAQAVENVLTENGTLTEDKVEAVGVGYDKSTANQANSKGSDRVDLLIQL